MSVATTYLAGVGTVGLIKSVTVNFPYHLLNSLICLSMAYILIFTILQNKKERIIATVITSLGIVIGIITMIIRINTPVINSEIVDYGEGTKIIEYNIENPEIATVEISEDGSYILINSSRKNGTTKVTVVDENNKEYSYNVTVNWREIIVK